MADPNQGQEPSMEDILASIRRIIDEDGRKAAEPSAVPDGVEPGDDEEVLDLTESVRIDPPDSGQTAWDAADEAAVLPEESVPFAPEPEPEAEPEPAAYPDPGVRPAGHDAPDPYEPHDDEPDDRGEPMTTSARERLVSDAALSSAAAALGTLARASERDPLEGVPRGRPIEELAMELLKPMLREWLDQNLPSIVERIVEREVRYLSRRLEADGRD